MPTDPNSVSGRWWSAVNKAKEKSAARLKAGEKSKAWYKGAEEFFKKEFSEWRGDLVRGNLWQRDYDILHDSLWADDPRFSVTAELDGFEAACASTETMSMRAWFETQCFEDMNVAFGQALHENIAWVALDYDRHAQLPRIRWVDGYVGVDPMAKGIIRRAQWISECVDRPLMDVYTDTAIPEPKRKEILKAYMKNHEKFDPEQTVKMAYIYSKRGAEPWAPTKLTSRKLVVICDKLEDPVLVTDWEWPFIDQTRFPLYMLRIKSVAGEQEGVTLFELLESLFRHFNWAVTFDLMSARREATKKVLVNEDMIREKTEQDKVGSGKHMEIILGKGNMEEAINVIELGNNSTKARDSAVFAKELHDSQSGITDVTRGEPVGGRATAEEVQTAKKGSAIVFQGIAATLDRFSNEVVHDFICACAYYIPAWSRIVGDDGQVYTKVKDFNTGMLTDMLCAPDELAKLGSYTPIPGTIVRAGVDAWVGPEHAYHWPEYDVEQLKRDFSFKVETGSARSDAMIDEQRNALAILQTLGQPMLQMGMIPQWIEMATNFIKSFRLKNGHKMLPPKDMQLKLQQMMMIEGSKMMAMKLLSGGAASGAPPGGNPGGDTMNLFGANPTQPFGAPQANGDAGPGSGFERSVAKRSSEASV